MHAKPISGARTAGERAGAAGQSGSDGARATPPRLARELPLALALALAAGLLYAATWQTRFFGDGAGLYTQRVLGGGERYPHVLFHPACDLLAWLFGGDPGRAPRLLSTLSAAAGVGLGWLVLRGCGAPRTGSLFALLLLALSPALWFFGTTVEVHALLHATVAFVAALIVWAPWRRPALALTLVAAAFPLLPLAHQASFVLGPGFVLLVQFARARRDRPYSWPALLLGVGPLLLAGLCAGWLLHWELRFGDLGLAWREIGRDLGSAHRYVEWQSTVWRDEWLLPLALLVPLAAAGFPRLRTVPRLAPAVGTLIAVPTAFFLYWDAIERGGYFLGSALFLCVPIAFLALPGSRAKAALAVLLVVVQAGFAHHRIAAYDRGFDPATRGAQVRAALGDTGLLLTTTALAPDIRCDLPEVEEMVLPTFAHQACTREGRLVSPAELVASMERFLSRLLERHERVAFDLSYRNLGPDDSPALAHFAPHLAALEAFLRERYVVREWPHPDWPLLTLEARR